ncbi:MAG: molecular chaperone DnaJ [archaeon]
MAKDYYKILGVEKNATKEEIKKAYKQLAKKFHPDVNKESDATEKFKEINEAAEVLADNSKRSQYDQFGDADAFKQASGFQGFDPRDFGFSNMGDVGGDFGDIFDMFFGRGFSSGGRKSYRGSDLRFDLTIGLDDVASGIEKTVIIPRLESCNVCKGSGANSSSDIGSCSHCGGSGRVTSTRRTPFGMFQTTTTCNNCGGEGKVIKNPCASCRGKGRVQTQAKIKINIPAGVEDGMRLRVSGEGEAGPKGGQSGDLYVVIHVKEHDVFVRDNDDLYIEVPVSFTQVTLGDVIEVPTIEGRAKLKIPSGTQSHTIFRIKGKGIPHLESSGTGDQKVRVMVQTPDKLSKKQQEILKEFQKESGENPSSNFLKKVFDRI